MTDILGWTASIIFSISGIPQAYRSYKQGHARGLSHAMIWLWFLGEGIAISHGHLAELPQSILFNYYVNFFSLCVIMRYRYFPCIKEETKEDK